VYSDIGLLWECQSERQKPVNKSFMAYYNASQRRQLQEMKRLAQEDHASKHWKWSTTVGNYNARGLADPEDRLNALAGVAHEVKQLLIDDYIFGIWRTSVLDFLRCVSRKE
jgi:hypothetical protein